MFSERTAWNRARNELFRRLEALRSTGVEIRDLTCSNPTRCGFVYQESFYDTLRAKQDALYAPNPLGLPIAREGVCAYYRAHGAPSVSEHVWITAGTSELYTQLLWLLCDPSDAILVPRPGYPLFDFIGDLTGVVCLPYELAYDGGWFIHMNTLRDTMASRPDVRVVIVVSPHNPTGHYVNRDELAALEQLCVEHEAALVLDEVFADYPLRPDANRVVHPGGNRSGLTFVVSGISKVAALPQWKLAWGKVDGPAREVDEALARLEIVNDTFLSAATPVQAALPDILAAAAPMRERIARRCRRNLELLTECVRDTPISLLDAEGGWTALLRLPALGDRDDLAWAMHLLDEERVYSHPGFLYDFPSRPPLLVVSLLTDTQRLREGVQRMVRTVLDAR